MHMGGSSGMSYADIERESVLFELQSGGSRQSRRSFKEVSFEPKVLDGGLDHNELAEIHAYRVVASMQREGSDTTDDYSTLPASAQFRGGIGINLDSLEIPNGGRANGTSPDDPVARNAEGTGAFAAFVDDEHGLLQQVILTHNDPYLNTGNGVGGGASTDRDVGGLTCFPVDLGIRGPVLDENDEFGIAGTFVNELETQTDVQIEAAIGVDLVYRIHTVEGIRRDFDLPE